MKILALDLGLSTGWAVDLSSHGFQRFQDVSKNKATPRARKIHDFRMWLSAKLDAYGPFDQVWYESPHHRGGDATRMSVGFSTVVEEECFLRHIDCFSAHSRSIKKFATGRSAGKIPSPGVFGFTKKSPCFPCAGKDEMKAALEPYGIYVESYDEADALWILAYASAQQDLRSLDGITWKQVVFRTLSNTLRHRIQGRDPYEEAGRFLIKKAKPLLLKPAGVTK